MTITLQSIKAEQNRLAEMISAFEQQGTVDYRIPEEEITLYPGERYAGIILDEDGEPSHHVVLLPGEAEEITWPNALKWAADQGGDLPTRQEQSLLFANLASQFEKSWYWSNTAHESQSGVAWLQYFGRGVQYDYTTSAELRARAVRRLTIE